MKFQLLKRTFQSPGTIDITEKHFNDIITSKRNLIVALGIEEKFNLVLENYAEFEQELLRLAVNRLVFSEGSWSGFQNDIFVANRRLANLLSSCRSYVDQLQHDLSQTFGRNSSELKEFKKNFKEEKIRTLGFHAMEELRNFTQHRSFPIHSLSFEASLDETRGTRRVKHAINPALNIEELRTDPKFDKELLSRLPTKGSMVAVMPLVREYIEGIGRIQMAVRKPFGDSLVSWEAVISNAVCLWEAQFGEGHIGLTAVHMTDDGEQLEAIDIFTDFIERRKFLQKRSSHAANLAHHFVTGEVTLEED